MDNTTVYKCPNCGGSLEYNAETHILHCDYCLSDFTVEELEELNNKNKEQEQSAEENFDEHARMYSCPNCGAEIITDDTTTATFCYYCHSPVILSEKLKGSMKPDYVIPFKINREEAEKRFFEWMSSKKFLPKAFIDKKAVEKMCGVYYPYWMTDCTVDGRYTATGKNLRVWVVGDIEYTETKVYDIVREGRITFDNIKNFAMDNERAKLATGVQPFKDEDMEKFSMAYLSGFMAENRDIETEKMSETVKSQVNTYAGRLLENTVGGYNMLSNKSTSIKPVDMKWEYVLLPVWVVTYVAKDKVYYFALNGQTGKTVGQIPIDNKKLFLFGLALFAVFFAVIMLIGGLIA